MGVKLYYGLAPYQLGPFQLQPQTVWYEGGEREILGHRFVDCAREGSGAMAPVALDVVENARLQSMEFDFPAADIWPDGLTSDPKLEAEVVQSIPAPAPKPEPVAEPESEPVAPPVGNDALSNALSQLYDKAVGARPATALNRALIIAQGIRELSFDYGPRALRANENFRNLVTLFDENADSAFTIDGEDIRELEPDVALYLLAWDMHQSGIFDDRYAMWVQFRDAAITGIEANSMMTYNKVGNFVQLMDTMAQAFARGRPLFETMAPNYAVSQTRTIARREATGDAFTDMRVAAKALSYLSSYVQGMGNVRDLVGMTGTGQYPQWFPLRYINNFFLDGCPEVVPFRSMRNTPANTSDIDPICKWFVDNLLAMPDDKHVTYVAFTLQVIESMCIPNTGYNPAEDRRFPAVASLYRFLKNGVWSGFVAQTGESNCKEELEALVVKASPSQNLSVYGFSAASLRAVMVRKFHSEAMKKGARYAQPATDFIEKGMPGIIPFRAEDFEGFEDLLDFVTGVLVDFGAARYAEYSRSSVGKVTDGPRALTVKDIEDNLRSAIDLTSQWRPAGMGADDFAANKAPGTRATFYRSFRDWLDNIDLKWFTGRVLESIQKRLGESKQSKTPDEVWQALIEETAAMFPFERPNNVELVDSKLIDVGAAASAHLRKIGGEWVTSLGETDFDITGTSAAFTKFCFVSSALNAEQYIDTAITLARMFYREGGRRESERRRCCIKALNVTYNALNNLRPLGMMPGRWAHNFAPAQLRKAMAQLGLIMKENDELNKFERECFDGASEFEMRTEAFISALNLLMMRPGTMTAPTVATLFEYSQLLTEKRAMFKNLEDEGVGYGAWWSTLMSERFHEMCPVSYKLSLDDMLAMVARSVEGAQVREEVAIRATIRDLCVQLQSIAMLIRPLGMPSIRWFDTAPHPLHGVISALNDIVDKTPYGVGYINGLVRECLPKTGPGGEVEAELARMKSELAGIRVPRLRMGRATGMIQSLRAKAQQDDAAFDKWNPAFNAFLHVPVLDLEVTYTDAHLTKMAVEFTDEELVGKKSTVTEASALYIDALQTVLAAAYEVRPLGMYPQAWVDLKVRPDMAPAVRGATAKMVSFLQDPKSLVDFVVEMWENQLSDADRYKSETGQAVPRTSGKIAYTAFGSGGSAVYKSVEPTVPQSGVDNSEVFSMKVGYQIGKIFDATLARGVNGGRVYSLPDNVLADLAKYSKCLGLKRALPASNFIVVGCEYPGVTSIATYKSAGLLVSVVYINMAEIAQHLGGATTQNILHALTHEFAHYFHKGLRNAALSEWRKATTGRNLHPAQGDDPYAFDTEQFAILAETMVWGNSLRGLYNCNGIDVVERFFVNNFITEEDRHKLA